MEFDRYTLVLLRWPEVMPEFTDGQLEELQASHVAFLANTREQGLQLAAGPCLEQADERLRGIAIFRTGLDETREILAGDPSVQAGRLVPELSAWMVPQGVLEG
jgi:uncharacterized protein YciI